MMKIILMRHGKPVLTHKGRISPVEMKRWIEHYDLSTVETDNVSTSTIKIANAAAFIVTSTTSRALASVRALGHSPSLAADIFCEAQLPFAPWRFPRLSPYIWVAFFRLLWFLGYSYGADSIKVTHARAQAAAIQLISLAEEGPVLLMGHGIMNHLIAKQLLASGWSGPKNPEKKYWSTSVYLRDT